MKIELRIHNSIPYATTSQNGGYAHGFALCDLRNPLEGDRVQQLHAVAQDGR